MTLAELRARMLAWLADPTGDWFDDVAAQTLELNQAYATVVADIDLLPSTWGMEDTPLPVSVLADTQKYDLGATIRRIVDVVELSSDGDEIGSLNERPWTTRHDRTDGYCVFQDQAEHVWLHLLCKPNEAFTLHVYYKPHLTALAADGDEPLAVPRLHHELVAVVAAINVKLQQRRDLGGLDAIYANRFERMRLAIGKGIGHSTGLHRG